MTCRANLRESWIQRFHNFTGVWKMPLKDILVYVDDSAQAAGTVAAACSLARRHDAHLTGLAVDRPPEIPGFAAIEIPPSAVEILRQQRQESLDKTRKIFDNAVNAAGLTDRSGFSVASGRPLESLSLRSRYADLTVIPQSGPEDQGGGEDLVDDLIMASGRPILVIPYIGAPAEIGRKVLVAWNGSREAARAVSDAMPVLERPTASRSSPWSRTVSATCRARTSPNTWRAMA